MKTEKLLVSYNQSEAEKEISKLQSYIPIFNRLPEVFHMLDLGKANEEISMALLTDRGESAIKMFENAIVANCMAIGNPNKHFINAQLEIQKPTIGSFKSEIESILNEAEKYFSAGGKYSYSEAEATYLVTERTKEEIIESYKTHLSDDAEIELYNEFEKVHKALQSLNKALSKFNGRDNRYSLMHYFEKRDHTGDTISFLNKAKILELFKKRIF